MVRLVSYEHANLRANDIWTVRYPQVTPQKLAPVSGFFDVSTTDEESDDY